MGFLSKAFSGVSGGLLGKTSKKYGWITGGENPYAENRVGNLLNNITGQSDAAAQSYAYDQSSADADLQRSVYLWKLQNEYNTPAAQIARLAAAGINVNPMTYAVGNGSMSSTASNISAPSSSGASLSGAGLGAVSALMSVLGGISGIRNQNAQTAYINQQTKSLKLANDENEDNGTSNATPYPVRIVKQLAHGGKAVVEEGSNPVARGMNYVADRLPWYDGVLNKITGLDWSTGSKSLKQLRREYQESLVRKKGYK